MYRKDEINIDCAVIILLLTTYVYRVWNSQRWMHATKERENRKVPLFTQIDNQFESQKRICKNVFIARIELREHIYIRYIPCIFTWERRHKLLHLAVTASDIFIAHLDGLACENAYNLSAFGTFNFNGWISFFWFVPGCLSSPRPFYI